MLRNDLIPLQRLWREQSGSEDDSQSIHWDCERYAKFSENKPLDHWKDSPFLFLIGQAGAGKSTYLKQLGSDSNILVIGIKEHGPAFLDVLQQEPKWIGFWNAANNPEEAFTVILDGWDELTEELYSRKGLIQLLSSSDRERFIQFRLRIASRPEIPEQRILDDLRVGCSWFVETAARKESPRLVLTPLCKDHIEAFWCAYGNGTRYQDFWKWGYDKSITSWFTHVQTLRHLITSYSQGKGWNSTLELWEEVLLLKVSEIEDRKKDIQYFANLPAKGKLVDAAGELALLYLLGGREAIPHSDISNKADRLPTFCELNRLTQRFLLSTPIFTPGGLENIHFAQAQEAEYLAARRLEKANVGLDNLIRLLSNHNGIPEPLQSLCKWIAKFDSMWLTYLGENHPSIAIQSVDTLTNPQIRDNLVRLWWRHPKTNRNDGAQIRCACEILSNESIPWLEGELQHLSPTKNARCLAYFLGHLNERPVSSAFLNSLQVTLQLPDLHEDLITEILDILSEKYCGDHSFWQMASLQWIQTERGERIPAIAQQLQRHGEPTGNILALFLPVSPMRQSFRYTEYSNDFFKKMQKSDLSVAIQWACHIPAKRLVSDYRHSWIGSAYEGLFEALIREEDVQGILTFAAHLWKGYGSFHNIVPDEKKPEEMFTKDLLGKLQDTLINSDARLLQFKERGILCNEWIFAENGKQKIMYALHQEVYNHGYSRKADLLVDIARRLGVVWSDHIDLLYACKVKAEEFPESLDVRSNQLEAIFRPVILGSEEAKNERKLHFDMLRYRRQNEARETKTIREKKVAWKSFYNEETHISSWDWNSIYHWLSYGYHIEDGYRHALPSDAFLKPFWREKLSAPTRKILIEKANECIKSLSWQSLWTEDFAQRKLKSNNSFTTRYSTLAPLFAWTWLWHEMGYILFEQTFATIDKEIWLRYLWAMEVYDHQEMAASHCKFLCSGMKKEQIQAIWVDHQVMLGESARLPRAFLKCEVPSIQSYLMELFSIPFHSQIDSGLLKDYAEENGTHYLQGLFEDWESKQVSQDLIQWDQLKFLLKQGLEPAWAWFLSYCRSNPTAVSDQFQSIRISRNSRGLALIKDWGEKTLSDCIEIVLKYFPSSSDPKHEGAYTPSWRDDVSDFRNSLYNILLSHGEWELPRICRDMKAKIPDFDPYGFVEQDAFQRVANHSLAKLNSKQISDLLGANGVVVLKDEIDFSQWIAELLYEFETKVLNGENGLATLLWDEHIQFRGTTLWREMKHEEAFSDLLKHWFEWRKLKSPLLPKREVQIYRCSQKNQNPRPSELGQRLDLDLSFQQLRLPFEVKRDKNPEWKKDGLYQLRDYLKRLSLRNGIYIVYGACAKGKEGMLAQLHPIVEAIAAEGYKITPVIIAI